MGHIPHKLIRSPEMFFFKKHHQRKKTPGYIISLLLILTLLLLPAIYTIVTRITSAEATIVPIANWKFDEGSGTTTKESIANANTGTLAGTTIPTWQSADQCIAGPCLYFDGTTSKVTVAGTASFKSVSMWVRPNSVSSAALADFGNNIRITVSSGVISASGFTSPTIYVDGQPNTTLVANKWQHVAVTSGTTVAGSSMQFGSYSTTFLKGYLDEIRMYTDEQPAKVIKGDFTARNSNRTVSAQMGAPEQDYLNQGLVGYWKMDESVGDTCNGATADACDFSGNGFNGDWVNNTTSIAGKYALGTDYDGTNDSLTIPDNDAFSANTTNQLTVAAWLYPDSNSGTQNVISKGNTSNYEWSLGANGSQVQALIWNSSGSVIAQATLSSGFTTGSWQHFAFTLDLTKNTLTLYKNGAVVGTGTVSGTYTNGTSDLRFGERADGSNDYDGKIDEVRIYKRVLSNGEINSLYAWQPGPAGYWKFDEATGTTTADSSGNGNTATITDGGTVGAWTNGKYGSTYFTAGHTSAESIGLTNSIPLGSQNTLSFWAYFVTFESGGNGTVVGGNSTASTDGYMFYIDNTSIYSRPATSSAVSISNTLSLNTWYHIAVVRDGTSIKFFVNGQQLGSTQTLAASNPFTMFSISNFVVGAGDFPLEGMIDDVRVYSYARTASQLAEDMNAGHPLGGSPLGTQTAYWKLDDQQGTTAGNSSQLNTFTTSISGATWRTKEVCKMNGCLDFDGTDDVLTVTNTAAIDFDTGLNTGFTFSAWINPDTVGEGSAGEIFNKNTSTYCRLGGSTPFNISCSVNQATDATLTVNSVVPANTWTHVALGWSDDADDELSIYINGKYMGSSTNGVGPLDTDSANLLIGGGTSNNFDGKIDDFQIYNGELTAAQLGIVDNANAAINFGTGYEEATQLTDGVGNAPILWNPFDDNTGTSAVDKSGNGRTGTLSAGGGGGISRFQPGKYGSGVYMTPNSTSDALNSRYGAVMYANDLLDSLTTGTVEFWFKPDDNSEDDFQEMFFVGDNSAGGDCAIEMGFVSSTNEIALYIDPCGAGSIINVTAAIPGTVTDWHHMAFTDSTAGYRVYLDGQLVLTGTTDYFFDNVATGTTYYQLGCTSAGANSCATAENYWGMIDEFKIYNYARTPAQIAYDFSRGTAAAWYKFDECTGTTLNNAGTGSSLNGTWSGSGGGNTSAGTCSTSGAWFNGVNGKYNSSLDFDGTDDVVTVTNNNQIDLNVGMFNGITWSAWIYPNSDGENDIGQIFNKGTNTYCRTDSESGGRVDIECRLDLATTDAQLNIPSAVPINQWSHIAFTWDNASDIYSIWINGVPRTITGVAGGDPAADTSNFFIGNNTGGTATFDGQIDDVRLFPYSMSAAQIKKVFNEGSVARFGPVTGSP